MKKGLLLFATAPFSVGRLYELFQWGDINALFVAFQKGQQLLGDELVPAGSVAFKVHRQDGVVDRQPQQEPTLALPLGKETRMPSRLSGAMAQFCSWA